MEGEPTDFWAKLERDDDGDIQAWHPLLAHSADVAATTEALLTHTILRRRLGHLLDLNQLTDVQIARLSALAALHDAGKANRGFQNRMHDDPDRRAGHVRPLVHFLDARGDVSDRVLDALDLMPLVDWFSEPIELDRALLATFGHHGQPVQPSESRFRPVLWREPDDNAWPPSPLAGLRRLRESIESWYPRAFESTSKPFPAISEWKHVFNGVLTWADWIASDTTFCPYAESDPYDIEQSRARAREALGDLGLDTSGTVWEVGDEPGFEDISPHEPYDIQRACLDQPIDEGGGLTILESDTGSGKTEAALARFVRLYAAGEVDGLYVALPTRSAAKQLHGRVVEAVERAFGDEAPSVVLAVPGYTRVDDREAEKLSDYEHRWPDDEDDEMSRRGWAAEHAKRFLAAPIAVGTVDQVLLSGLRVRHAHLRAAALARHFLVVDEVHASDTYMTRLLESVLDHHLSMGGHALLMSATLGSEVRHRLSSADRLQAPPSLDEALERDYPLITHTDGARESKQHVHASSHKKADDESESPHSKTVEAQPKSIADHPEEVARLALQHARRGARVLVIRNTVGDCRATQRHLENIADREEDTEHLFAVADVPTPHHSRYAPADRKALDTGFEDVFGAEADRDGVVAIATQTVEQSLDIDADLLISDLCPIDVLLQRIGRLHRHDTRERPLGYEDAHTIVAVPDSRDLGDAIRKGGEALGGDHGLGTVYRDLRVLEATWRLLAREECWTIPEMNRELVEHATHSEALADITEDRDGTWEAHEKHVLGEKYARRTQADHVRLERDEPFGDSPFPGREMEEAVQTRLGADDRKVELPRAVESPFGTTIEEVTISGWLLDDDGDDELELESLTTDDEGFEFSLRGRPFRYDRGGLHPLE